ncbi:MAG: aminoglycoside phosphotransferase family protein [Oscillospiraceae bacterium]|nr:aminoglycoside phosphotransferase family protein [Oscillospiraceae bacterium]
MTDDMIEKLFAEKKLGAVILPISPVSGGFQHKMYKVVTENGSFAVKHLNPDIMKRPDAIGNFRRADALEKVLEDAGIPVVPAIMINGSKLQKYSGEYFYIYPWQKGQTADLYDISADQCRIAGSIQGRIHAIAPAQIPKPVSEFSCTDWNRLIDTASARNHDIRDILKDNTDLLIYAENEMNKAQKALLGIECIVDEDMDPKNVIWDEGEPRVIDLECLERGNPVSSALQLSLQWAGATVCDLDFAKLRAFFDGYLEAYDNGFRDYSAVFGLAYTWTEWLAYNIRRAAGECADEAEREMGAAQVRLTIDIIRYLFRMEDSIRQHLEQWFK